jgi:hypothetical protein
MPIALTIIGIIAFSLLVGTIFNFGSIILAIPLLIIFFSGMAGSESFRRQKRIMQLKKFRRDARAKKIDFDEEDKRTIAV